MLTPGELKEFDAKARRKFTYKSDPVAKDTWRSHADDVLAGNAWVGDCDDLASTVLDLLGRAGVLRKDRFRLYVASDGTSNIDHMVAAVMTTQGYYVVGDTFKPTYPASAMPHKAIAFVSMSDIDNVKQHAPWSKP